ncbi:GntR family transcriptional regulator [Rhodococcoides trifolii]|uniref:GntR family transcriptional regulator n=1 Tax=Rhodococcoides trifolii TaxID=908250 RepID=A0A917FTK0_9NOCA|nr:aminotransferase class I/II-fold pyridoxal phosphate-dependent enzyme [Rhodococcus trifolii]GGG00547.1 GntR family transcriptional regulator [Rhodococcus trifolii]
MPTAEEGLVSVLGDFVGQLDDRTAAGIAAAVSRRIRSGAVQPGERLPTVRELARELKVSPATVNQAWQALAGLGVIVSRGRAGTFVTEPGARNGTRYWRLHPPTENGFTVDLSRGTPDPALLPDLSTALKTVAGTDLAANYLGDAVLPELDAAMRATWPFVPERIAVMDGALDAVDRLLRAHVHMGDRVVVEDPCFPPFLDLLARVGAKPVPVPVDSEGMRADLLAVALRVHSPAAVMLQTRAHNPTGVSLTESRVSRLARILEHSDVVVIEDDHSGDVAGAADLSLGSWIPGKVAHVRSYSKSHGADLRLSVLGGAAAIVDDVIERRMLGPGWTSRLLQRLLLAMLDDPVASARVRDARDTYRARAASLIDAVSSRGVDVGHVDGFNLWLPVLDQSAAMVSLAAAGIKTAPGEVFRVADFTDHHLRVTTSSLQAGDIDWVATELAVAARTEPQYGRRR